MNASHSIIGSDVQVLVVHSTPRPMRNPLMTKNARRAAYSTSNFMPTLYVGRVHAVDSTQVVVVGTGQRALKRRLRPQIDLGEPSG